MKHLEGIKYVPTGTFEASIILTAMEAKLPGISTTDTNLLQKSSIEVRITERGAELLKQVCNHPKAVAAELLIEGYQLRRTAREAQSSASYTTPGFPLHNLLSVRAAEMQDQAYDNMKQAAKLLGINDSVIKNPSYSPGYLIAQAIEDVLVQRRPI